MTPQDPRQIPVTPEMLSILYDQCERAIEAAKNVVADPAASDDAVIAAAEIRDTLEELQVNIDCAISTLEEHLYTKE